MSAAEAQIAEVWRQRSQATAAARGDAPRASATGPSALPTRPVVARTALDDDVDAGVDEWALARSGAPRRDERDERDEPLARETDDAVTGFEALLSAGDAPPRGGRSAEARPARDRDREREAYDAVYGDGYGAPPKKSRRGPVGCLVALLVILALGVVGYFMLKGPVEDFMAQFEPAADYTGAGTGEVDFTIESGDDGGTIATNLYEQGVTASYDAFYDLVAQENPTFYPGVFRLANEMSARSALDALLDDANRMENTFVVTEGMWARDALALAAEGTGIPIEELQAAAADPAALGLPAEATNVEGFLFPATYSFGPDATAAEVVGAMVDRSMQAYDAAGVAPADRWRTAIIASMLEREAGLRDDYYKVSRVIQNRLDPAQFPSGLLQFDSTVHYGLGDDTVITTTDAQRNDPANVYNTYVHPGLPPGPIGNPGDLAIDAALHPADGTWIYFVTVNLDTGETVFSTTLAEHEAAVEQYQAWLRANPGYGE
ncbi:endolytic transglycosylase MltG [Agromyces sp. MMS17-SY077]|uniref:Endolytic murein transglycosylase n=2 Tax=Agromyces seonyuensis TaxID=2662446 RepID=A0A6I4P4W2_9MICO|nr:endolytic transglycosylase MltG [Agromyces seonyuensis]MWB98404.1 endolytic transglycosylase MltG [Agromyces seonyuensis]